MNCLVCDIMCKYFHKPDSLYPNIDGTMFESTGNYGSRVWDMEGAKFLQAVICNECLIKRAKRVNVVEWTAPPIVRKKLARKIDLKSYRKENGYE